MYGYPINSSTPLNNYANIINTYTRKNDYIWANSNIDKSNIMAKKLVVNDIIVTKEDDKIWCTQDYVVSGREYYNIQVMNEVTLPTPITGTINDSTSFYNRSICEYYNSTYARINFRNGGGLTTKWVNYIWDSNDGIHYKLNTSKSSNNIFNVNSPNCLNYAFIYINGSYEWPLQYFMFDGTYENIKSIERYNGSGLENYDFNMTAINKVGTGRYLAKNGIYTTDITSIQVPNITQLNYRINLYKNAFNLNIDTLTSTASLFKNYMCCTIPNINTNNVTNMASMFYNCRYLITIPNINTEQVTDMSNLFYHSYNLLYVPNFNTSSVTNMSNAFVGCADLKYIPNFDTKNVINFSTMLYGCNNLIEVPNFSTNNAVNMVSAFYGLTTVSNFPNFNTNNVTNMASMFRNCSRITSTTRLNTTLVTSMSHMYDYCTSLETVYQYNTSNVSYMAGMFANCNNLSNASIQNIINMVLNSNVTSESYKTLNTENINSPLYNTKFSNSYYSNRHSELTAAGWEF